MRFITNPLSEFVHTDWTDYWLCLEAAAVVRIPSQGSRAYEDI